MPTFEFTSPEGKIYEIEGPEGSTKEQAFEILQKQIGTQAQLPEKKGTVSLQPFQTQGGASIQFPKSKRDVRGTLEEDKKLSNTIIEGLFGKGTPEETPIKERAAKITESGLSAAGLAAGAKALAPSMIAGGKRLMTMPSTAPKVAGGALTAAGTLAEKIGPKEIGVAGMAGGGGETIEQLASAMGLPRGAQVGSSMVGVPIGQAMTQMPGKVFDLLIKGPARTLAKSMFTYDPVEQRASQLRKEAIDTARDFLGLGKTTEAGQMLDKAIKEGIALKTKQKEAEALLQKQIEEQRLQKLKGILTQQETVQANTLQDIERANINFGAKEEPERLGQRLQGEVVATQKPIIDKRATEYQQLYSDAIETARQRQAQGDYWQTSEGGKAVRQYWMNRINKGEFTKAQESEILGILDDIYLGMKETKSVPGVIKTEKGRNVMGEKEVTERSPKDIKAIDSWVRVLGDKANYGAEVEGAKALSSKQAADLRRTLTRGIGERGKESGGVYDWEAKFGAAKGLYSEKSELLKAWETKTGKKVTAEETKPLEVLGQYFNGRAGYKDLVTQLGGDEVRAAKYGTQQAVNEVRDLSPEKINQWLNTPKNGWVNEVPGLKQKIQAFADQKASLGSKGEKAGVDVERLQKEIPVIEKNLQTWSSTVDEWAKEHYKDIIGSSRPQDTFADILTSKKQPSNTQLKALSTYIGQNPEAKKLVPDAVANIIIKESPKTVVDTFNTRIAPVLEQTGLMNKKQINEMRDAAIKIYQADAKDYTIPKNKKKLRAANYVYGIIASQAGMAGASYIPSISQGEK